MTRSTFLILGAMAMLACDSPTIPDSPPAIEGSIVARNTITATSGNRETLHIKSSAADACGIIFAIQSDTHLLRRTDDGAAKVSISEFTVGKRVRAWARVVMDSCPGQAFATTVELID